MSGFVKDPDSTLDYGIDWSRWLEDEELISSSQWDVPNDLTIVEDTFDPQGKTVVWLSGGVAGQLYTITNRINTNSQPVGRIEDRSITIRVREK